MPNSPSIKPFTSGTATSATLDQVLTSILEVQTINYNKLFVLITASVQAIDQFAVLAKPHYENTVYATIASASGDYTSPSHPILTASGDLTALSGATGYFIMDVSAMESVDIQIAFGADNGTYVIDYGLQ